MYYAPSPSFLVMEWWLKAGLTLVGVTSAFTVNHLWKEHYRKVKNVSLFLFLLIILHSWELNIQLRLT